MKKFTRIGLLTTHTFKSLAQNRKSSSLPLSECINKRNALYNAEVKRQKESIGRIEKISVCYEGVPKNEYFAMNRQMSTPYHVALHINEFIAHKSVLGLVDGQRLWDMHRPLDSDCTLQFLNFVDSDPHHCNKAYWRSCSFLLGALAETCFKDSIHCNLHSFPSPNVKSGSFVYDVQLSLDDWTPSKDELRILSAEFSKLCRQHLPFHRLDVDPEVALEIFSYNPFKSSQIPDIAMNSPGNKITLYRVGDHVDISRGPMINNTKQIGRATITAVHKLESELGQMFRFQGVSIPAEFRLNHFAYNILEERAMKLNQARVPGPSEFAPGLQSAEIA
ncbi:39S ribosomal protein L39, mitochondrial [Macrosteles quadrilineatus]|uniref:39S ribosomal protein L39, mitochondrial n=1 Tax=Macrosteles quadrilineatus TaxID=74068 RepID=UPI0023E348CD|nr:39S ribosomal protein L39, mitochondrial [Macrosteles quadrilineatus]